nr:MAG TPA: KilAC domain protein [Caudoviricetes sp.]
MTELIKINYDTEHPTVSARDLHEQLNIGTAFKDWFPRMCEYGFEEGKDFCSKLSETSSKGGRPSKDADISVDMAKQICMLQRTEKGRECRQYFIDLEKAWNTPERIMERALQFANKSLERFKTENEYLISENRRMKPKEIFADAVTTSHTAILIGDLAKLLKQNGIETGQKRLFSWMRENGYLIKRQGSDYNMPTQKSMEMKLFEVKESTVNNPDGSVRINKTTKVTGKGQQYFINKFLVGLTAQVRCKMEKGKK